MAELTGKPPCDGLLPLEIGAVTLVEADPGRLTSVAPYRGGAEALGRALVSAHGLDWPAPNRMSVKGAARLIWFGRDMALLAGPAPAPGLAEHAALTDQSDAWAAVDLAGDDAEQVLARLVPIDLRAAHFAVGHTARTLIGHMTASITRLGPDRFLILVFRSMAGTLVHDLKTALEAVAARR